MVFLVGTRRVLPGSIRFYWFFRRSERVLSDLIEFDKVVTGFTECSWIGTGLNRVSIDLDVDFFRISIRLFRFTEFDGILTALSCFFYMTVNSSTERQSLNSLSYD